MSFINELLVFLFVMAAAFAGRRLEIAHPEMATLPFLGMVTGAWLLIRTFLSILFRNHVFLHGKVVHRYSSGKRLLVELPDGRRLEVREADLG